MEFNVSCPECGNFVQIQKGDPVCCPKCGEVDIDTSPMDFGDTHTTKKRFRVVAHERFCVRTEYIVEAESAEQAEEFVNSGHADYESHSVEEGEEEYLWTEYVEEIDENGCSVG